MIIWNDKMFVTDSVKDNLKKIKKKIEKPEKLKMGAYLVTLSNNGIDLFEIYNILFFPGKHFNKEGYDVNIVGVAKDSEEAYELVGNILTAIDSASNNVSREEVIGYFGI